MLVNASANIDISVKGCFSVSVKIVRLNEVHRKINSTRSIPLYLNISCRNEYGKKYAFLLRSRFICARNACKVGSTLQNTISRCTYCIKNNLHACTVVGERHLQYDVVCTF